MPPDELDVIFPDLQGLLTADWGTAPGSPLSIDPEHGGVSAEALDAYLRDNAGRPLLRGLENSGGGIVEPRAPAPAPVLETSPGEGDDEEPEEEEEGVPPTPPTPPTPPAPQPEPSAPVPSTEVPEVGDVIRVGDQVFTRDQLEAFGRWRTATERDPALQQLLTAYYSGQLTQPPAAPAPPLAAPAPAYLPPAPATAVPSLAFTEDDDPRLTQLLQVAQAQQRQIEALTAGVQGVAARETARSEADLQSLVNRAANSFKEQHSLSDEEIQRLRLSASRMGSINSLMMGFDPITGVPQRPDILEATDRALEIAYYADPQLRQRMIDEAIATNRERNRKRQRLAAVGGSSGSVSRQPAEPPRPGTPAAHEALVGEVGAMLAGTWQEPGR